MHSQFKAFQDLLRSFLNVSHFYEEVEGVNCTIAQCMPLPIKMAAFKELLQPECGGQNALMRLTTAVTTDKGLQVIFVM